MSQLRCICQNANLPEHVIQQNLEDADRKRLERIRLSRKIDSNPDLIWCPNKLCQKDIQRSKRRER